MNADPLILEFDVVHKVHCIIKDKVFCRYAYSLNPNPWEWLTSREASSLLLRPSIFNIIISQSSSSSSQPLRDCHMYREAAESMAEKVRIDFEA